MTAVPLSQVIRRLRGALVGQGAAGQTDSDLLGRYVRHRDEAAFEALVRRHGPMVLGVCRRVLHNPDDAEDAFQATFLVLVRKAAALRSPGLLGNWLYGVAYRTALEARKAAARRRAKEAKMVPATETAPAAWDDLRLVLDQELQRLPEKYRAVLVLCYLGGETRSAAARQLGWPEGTVASRLAGARGLLAKRLARRGLAVSAGALAALLSRNASASVPAPVLSATLRAAVGGTLPTQVAGLTKAVLQGLSLTKLRSALAVLLVLAVAGGGLALFRHEPPAAGPPEAPRAPAKEVVEKPTTDQYGDPLPAGALARLGTVRLRHPGGIWSLAFSADGKTVVSGGNDATARLWDVATGKELRRFVGRWGLIKSVALTLDGKALVTGGRFSTFHFWDTATGEQMAFAGGGHDGGAGYCVALAADGKTLASADHNLIQVWDVARRERLRILDGPASAIEALALTRDGKLLATAGRGKNRDVRVWEAATGKVVRVLKGHAEDVLTLAFSPDGKTLASGGHDKAIRLWDVGTGKEIRQLAGHTSWVEGVAFSPDGKLLASGSRDSTARLWDVTTGNEVRPPLVHHNPVIAVTFSPDGSALATGGFEGRVRLWDVRTGTARGPAGARVGPVYSAAFLPDGKTVISRGDEKVRLWGAATGRERRGFDGPQGAFYGFALSPDCTTVAVCDSEGVIRLYSIATGKETRRLVGHKYTVFGLAFTPDGKALASAGYDNTIRLWDAATGKEARQFKGEQRFPHHIAFSPDGRVLATAGSDPGSDQTLRLWDVASGKQRHCVRLAPVGAFDLAFSPDGTTLATVGGLPTTETPGEVRLWDVATGKELRRFEGHTEQVLCVAFSPDGRTLVTGGADKTIRFWEVATGKERRQLRGHESLIGSVAFSLDGRRLVSTSHDTTGLVWDVTGHLRGGRLEALDLSPQQLEARWNDLADHDAVKAYRAVWDMAASGDKSVSFLWTHLKPAPAADAGQIARWARDLDSDNFEARTRATQELEKLGDLAGPALRKLLAGQPSAETRKRATQLLGRLGPLSGERLRVERAVEALEHTASPEARRLLAALAAGAPEAGQTRQAKAALRRLERRPAAGPGQAP
jgi:RNA polymerase sigma factor (sigma-70 family)